MGTIFDAKAGDELTITSEITVDGFLYLGRLTYSAVATDQYKQDEGDIRRRLFTDVIPPFILGANTVWLADTGESGGGFLADRLFEAVKESELSEIPQT